MKMLLLTSIAVLVLMTTANAQGLFSNPDTTCRSWGTVPGTNAYVQCRIYQDQQKRQRVRDIQRNLKELGETLSPRPSQAQVCFQTGMFTVCQ